MADVAIEEMHDALDEATAHERQKTASINEQELKVDASRAWRDVVLTRLYEYSDREKADCHNWMRIVFSAQVAFCCNTECVFVITLYCHVYRKMHGSSGFVSWGINHIIHLARF